MVAGGSVFNRTAWSGPLFKEIVPMNQFTELGLPLLVVIEGEKSTVHFLKGMSGIFAQNFQR